MFDSLRAYHFRIASDKPLAWEETVNIRWRVANAINSQAGYTINMMAPTSSERALIDHVVDQFNASNPGLVITLDH